MNGYAPLSPTTIRDWCALEGITLRVEEVQALYTLDRVLRSEPNGPPKDDE